MSTVPIDLPAITPSEVAMWVLGCAAFVGPLKRYTIHKRNKVHQEFDEEWMLFTLEKFTGLKKSPHNLRMLKSDVQYLKLELSTRKEMPTWKSRLYERNALGLQSVLNAWIQEEAAPHPQPPGPEEGVKFAKWFRMRMWIIVLLVTSIVLYFCSCC